jgi:sulfur-carrier protein
MEIRIRYYNFLRDIVGTREEQLEVPNQATVLEVLRQIAKVHPAAERALFLASGAPAPNVRAFVNSRSLLPGQVNTQLQPGDEIALFPAIAGG